MSMIRIGIIGSIKSAVLYMPVIDSIKDIELKGLYDPFINITDDAHTSELSIYARAETLLDEVDIICFSDNNINFKTISDTIKKAKHIILPYPFILNESEADIFLKIAGEAGVKVHISLNDYYHHVFSSASDLVKNPLYIESRILRNIDDENLTFRNYDKIMYDILIILELARCDIKRVLTHNVPVFNQQPELINIRIEFNNGCVANFVSDKLSNDLVHKYLFYQKGSLINIDLLKQIVELSESSETIKTINLSSNDTLKEELKSFIKCIQDDAQPKISLQNYLTTCQLIQTITNKTENN